VRGTELLLSLCLVASPLGAEEPLKADVLFVGAHPDDDSTATATLARLALDEGRRVAVVTATRGEGGGNAVGLQAGPALGMIREAEQRRALGLLGIHHVFYLDRDDFGFTLSAEATAERWGEQATLERLVRTVRSLRPDVLITMNPVPRGHGHHQLIARLATDAFWSSSDPSVFPTQLRSEFLRPWQPKKLYYALEYGAEGLQPSLAVDAGQLSASRGKTYSELESAALREYRSQGWAHNMPTQPRQESFLLGASLVGPVPDRSLLDGVNSAFGLRVGAQHSPVTWDRPSTVRMHISNWSSEALHGRPALRLPAGWGYSGPETVTVEPGGHLAVAMRVKPPAASLGKFELQASLKDVNVPWYLEVSGPVHRTIEPAAALARFSRWARRWGMEHLVQLVPPQVVAAQGSDAAVRVRLQNLSARLQTALVQVERRQQQAALRPGEHKTLRFALPVSREASPGPRPLSVDFAPDATLAVVPSIQLPGAGTIPHDRLWEGTSDGPADLSARFRLSQQGAQLFFSVQVSDDVVVSNLEEGDNKGHWRTDSVEVCIDPLGPGASDHTLSTYKLGIVPFNRNGRPMAARDADARPGPVKLAGLRSTRTEDGYRVQAQIPLADIPLQPGRPFGLNVLIYDADKREAAPGENANEARIAWSAWETVQGQPRLWGHVLP
jgi:LmbE family N-acetylglucosaminyl deacetylase